MLAKRIIPCLDVKDGMVVKGIQFNHHKIIGDILEYAQYYRDQGADELVFYDITASCDGRVVDKKWISNVAKILDIPFSVAGGICSLEDAKIILNHGADKVSINSPALANPDLISQLSTEFGRQCVVVGIDSHEVGGHYCVRQYTGDVNKSSVTSWQTLDWAQEVQRLGAGEIVLNCMNQDGMKNGYDVEQLSMIRRFVNIPLIASGGAGELQHFADVFNRAQVDGALAASVFHDKKIQIAELKQYLSCENIEVRI
jgi:cyclase